MVNKEFTILERQLSYISEEIEDPLRKSQLKKVIILIEEYKKSVKNIIQIIKDKNVLINNNLNKIGDKIGKITEDIKVLIKKDEDIIGENVQESNINLLIMVDIIS